MSTLGSYLLLIAFVVCAYAAAISVAGARRRSRRLIESGIGAFYLFTAVMTVASSVIIHAFVTGNYSIKYVQRYSDSVQPLFYKITSFWGGLDGSIMFWVLMLSLFGSAAIYVNRERHRELIPYVVAVISIVQMFFLFLMVIHNNPFETYLTETPTDGRGLNPLTQAEEKDLYAQIQNLYVLPANLRTLSVLGNTLQKSLAVKLEKWVRGGQYEQVFDNEKDTLTLSRFQCFDFEGMDRYPELIEPLLFYILHRANASICKPEAVTTFKTFFIDEAWRFFGHPTIRNYIVEALKTWRKKNAAMILSTQSLDELDKSEIVNVVIESCATKIFLANPDMDRELYRNTFHLNDNEIEMISTLIPKRQALVKRPDLAKVVNLEVDEKSYWLYTSDPNESFRREQAFREHGFEKGLEILARSSL